MAASSAVSAPSAAFLNFLGQCHFTQFCQLVFLQMNLCNFHILLCGLCFHWQFFLSVLLPKPEVPFVKEPDFLAPFVKEPDLLAPFVKEPLVFIMFLAFGAMI